MYSGEELFFCVSIAVYVAISLAIAAIRWGTSASHTHVMQTIITRLGKRSYSVLHRTYCLYPYGIYAGSNSLHQIIIRRGNITAQGSTRGILADGNLTILGGTVSATPPNAPGYDGWMG